MAVESINYKYEIQRGLETAFIDQTVNANPVYCPEFISNDPDQGKRVLTSIERELVWCEEFSICVAFVTLDGVTP